MCRILNWKKCSVVWPVWPLHSACTLQCFVSPSSCPVLCVDEVKPIAVLGQHDEDARIKHRGASFSTNEPSIHLSNQNSVFAPFPISTWTEISNILWTTISGLLCSDSQVRVGSVLFNHSNEGVERTRALSLWPTPLEFGFLKLLPCPPNETFSSFADRAANPIGLQPKILPH
jgi:hypothetical protein